MLRAAFLTFLAAKFTRRESVKLILLSAASCSIQAAAAMDSSANMSGAEAESGHGRVPAQTFLMGDEKGTGTSDQRPVHPVTLSRYYIAPYMCTVQDYCDFLNAVNWHTEQDSFIVRRGGGEVLVNLPYSPVTKKGARYEPRPGTARQPMYYVTWEGSALYCNYLSEREQLSLCYHPDSQWACDFGADGYHLPTEAQWECAARGGKPSISYPWGDRFVQSKVNCNGIPGHITNVGHYAPNAYGLYDMAGNVFEWCHDWYKPDYYQECGAGARDPVGPAADELPGAAVRVLRGGAYYQPASFVTCAYRYGTSDTKGAFSYNGFRVARQSAASDNTPAYSSSSGTAAEMKLVREWVAAAFTQPSTGREHASHLPLSFTYGGQPSTELLRNWTVACIEEPAASGRNRKTIRLHDPLTKLDISCEVTTFEQFPAVDWVLQISNQGTQDTPILEDVHVLDYVFRRSATDNREFILRHSRGSRADVTDFAPADELLGPGEERTFGGHGGRPSDESLPYMNLCQGREGIVLAIGWSGQWQARFQRDRGRALHISTGMERMRIRLHPGESIRTPRMLLLFWDGESLYRGHNLFRQLLLAQYSPRIDGRLIIPPIAASVAGLNGYTEENQLAAVPKLKERGFEVQWIDAGWFVGGWPNGAGNWVPNPKDFPHGLGPVGDAIHRAGMKFLLWFEIERVSRGSRIAREHPEWVIGPITEYGGLFNWGIPDARKWITDLVSDQITRGKVDIFRMDFNMEPLMYWWRNDAPGRQGMTEIRFVEGMYQIWDELRARHPGLWIDNCASGGRMFDLETAIRSISLTQSDAPYEPDRQASATLIGQLQDGGLNLYLPLHSGGCYGLEPSYAFRSAMMSGNVLGVDINTPVDQFQQTISIYKRVRPYFEGDYYPLFSHRVSDRVWYGYQLHRHDAHRGMVVLFRRSECLVNTATITLNDIEPHAAYSLTDKDSGHTQEIKGSALRALTIKIEHAPGSRMLFYEQKQ